MSAGTSAENSGAIHAAGSTLPAAFRTPGSASFSDFLSAAAPDLLPGRRPVPQVGAAANLPGPVSSPGSAPALPHGTTIVSITYAGGVIMAGDRRATAGSMIASRDIEKVFPADAWSCVGIAGTAGLAVELVRLFQVELEHYEKIEGALLSLDGKANRLATMVRGNLGLAMQGLAVVPLFAGWDLDQQVGRIFSYDVTGGRYEEHRHHAVGSGSLFARGALKKLWRPAMSEADAVRVAVEALYDAADDDSATGGPDAVRRIWPVVASVSDAGYVRVPEGDLADVAAAVVTDRTGAEDSARTMGQSRS